ncbi:MAG TPA: tetratricopeptide repeat protein [Vicinamibacteria bacterium]|nr:tetratricopeptide repeat protein [Vicinamibacteria bacterium]
MILGEIWAGKRVLCLFSSLVCLFFLPGLATSEQAELATFRGRVVDVDGKPIADATVTLEDQTMGGTITVETNDKGSFYRRGLRPSEYKLTITKEGYMDLEVPLQFRAGEEKREEFQMVAAMSGAEAAFQKGIEAFNAGEFEAAIEAFEEVTRLSPETPEGHTNLALAYIQVEKMPEAIQELEKAAELSADFRTWAQLAMAYVRVDRLQAAARSFETALGKEHDPRDPIAYECWMALGSLYFADNRVGDAVTAYENALSIDSGSAEALVALGKCQFNLRDMDKARQYFQRTIDTAPSSPQAEEARAFLDEIEKQIHP